MKTLLAAVALVALVGAALPAPAEDGNTSLRSFHAETAKARAQGGYGNPFVAVPKAIMQALRSIGNSGTAGTATARASKRPASVSAPAKIGQ